MKNKHHNTRIECLHTLKIVHFDCSWSEVIYTTTDFRFRQSELTWAELNKFVPASSPAMYTKLQVSYSLDRYELEQDLFYIVPFSHSSNNLRHQYSDPVYSLV